MILTQDIFLIKIILFSLFLSFSVYLFLKQIPHKFANLFGTCVSSTKTSKFHPPMVRGIGIIFPLILFFSSMIWGSLFSFFELSIIFISTVVGFFDDKYGLTQKQKLVIFCIIGFFGQAILPN